MSRREILSSTACHHEEEEPVETTFKSAMRLQEEQDLLEQEAKYQREFLTTVEKAQPVVQDKLVIVVQESDLQPVELGV